MIRHLGITSLLVGSFLMVFLDMIDSSSSCHGSHRSSHYPDEPYVLTPKVEAADTIAVGATWAELNGLIVLNDSTEIEGIQDFGFEYKESGGKDTFQKRSAGSFQTTSYSVKINGLKPSTAYLYRAYLLWDNYSLVSSSKTFTTEDKE